MALGAPTATARQGKTDPLSPAWRPRRQTAFPTRRLVRGKPGRPHTTVHLSRTSDEWSEAEVDEELNANT